MSWIYLVAAILLEISGTTCMKLSQGFTRLLPAGGMVLFYLASFGLLTLALRTIEVGVAYAIWAGVGTAAIAAIGILFFAEQLTVIKVFSIGLIVVGVVLLNLTGQAHS